jgi:magnesium-transporting ATPase (P-type)
VYFFGFSVTLGVIGFLCLTQAVYFTFNKEAYKKWVKFFDPETYQVLKEEGDNLLEKNRKRITFTLYFYSALLLTQVVVNPSPFDRGSVREFITSWPVILGFVIFISLTIFIGETSRKNSLKDLKNGVKWEEMMAKKILLGVIITLVLFFFMFLFISAIID